MENLPVENLKSFHFRTPVGIHSSGLMFYQIYQEAIRLQYKSLLIKIKKREYRHGITRPVYR